MSMNFFAIKRVSLGVFLTTLVLLLGSSRTVPAQEPVVETWAAPENLSRSGSTSDPVMVMASNGVVHAVWKDLYEGSVYARRVDGAWTNPTAVNVPWGTNFDPDANNVLLTLHTPKFVPDQSGRIHAFWIASEGGLYYSIAFSDQFGDGGWGPSTLLAEAVIDFDVTIDDTGTVRVTYVTNADTEAATAGVYVQTRNNANAIWSLPVQLYGSQYLRGLDPSSVGVKMHVVEAGSEEGAIYVMWDNQPRKQLFIARSPNGGASWEAPVVVAEPEGILDTNVPIVVDLVSTNDELLLVWKETEDELSTNCLQFYQEFSLDGVPASAPQIMYRDFPGCPVGDQQLFFNGAVTILQSTIFGATYLVAWDGSSWSIPQVQNPLANFSDPGTFQPLNLGCLSLILTGDDELLLVGCDTGSGADIWFTSRPLQTVPEWFTRSVNWSSADSLITTDGVIAPIAVVPDNGGLLHAFWGQTSSASITSKNIYYGRWDGQGWSNILSIISPPAGTVAHMDVELDRVGDRLYLVWSGGERGEIFFSWATASLAGSPTEWAAPVQLPMPRPVGTGADIFLRPNGEVLVAYSVPVNENRGVYLVRSTDAGKTWTIPTRILDGIGFGWEVVGSPSIDVTPNGDMHALILRLPPPESGTTTTRLYYSRSIDDGLTWSSPTEVIGGEVATGLIGSVYGQSLFRYWQETGSGVVTNFLQTSQDQGATWSETMNFIGLDSETPTSNLIMDPAGNVHLVQVAEGLGDQILLQEWVWSESTWTAEDVIEISTGGLAEASDLVLTIRSDGQLGVLFSKQVQNTTEGQVELLYTERQLNVSALEAPPPVPTVTPAPTGTPVSAVTETPAVNAVPTELAGQLPNPPEEGDNILVELLIGFGAAVVVVFLAFVLINRVVRRT